MASAADGGGTKTTLALAPPFLTAYIIKMKKQKVNGFQKKN